MRSSFNLLTVYILLMLTGCANLEESPLQMFRRDLLHSGIYDPPPITGKPEPVWEYKCEGRIYGSPVISGNRLYMGDDKGNFYAIAKETGELVWKFSAGGAIRSTPAVYRSNVFFMCDDGLFYALHAVDGEPGWTFHTTGERRFSAPGIHGLQPRDSVMVDDWDFYSSSPAVADERIYFGTGTGNLFCLDASGGKEIWTCYLGDVVHSSPAIAYGKVYAGSWNGIVYAVDQETGDLSWAYQTGIDTVNYNQVGIQSSPVIADSTIYIGSRDAHIYSLDALTGNLNWKFFNDYSWVIVTPVVYGDQLIYATSDSRKFRVLERDSGRLLYDLELGGFIFSSPVIAGDYCYFGAFNGLFYAVDLDRRKIAWQFQTRESATDRYKILNEDLTVDLGKIFTGPTASAMKKALDYLESVGPILTTPVVEDGVVYFGTQGGTLYAVR